MSGVDLNAAMIDPCRERRLVALYEDALSNLRSRADLTCELVSDLHWFEHLPFPASIELLAEVHRVLLPGDTVILETPNARNILVGRAIFTGI